MYQIYVITNTDNGKKYVGQTCRGVAQRWMQHKSAAKSGIDNYFYRAIRKHGEGAFSLEVVEEIETIGQSNEAERKWIAQLDSIDSNNGYNGTHGGDGSMPTDLTCQKISETRKELFQDPDFKARMAEANTGKRHTEEGKANIAKALEGNQYRKGIPHDEATKKKVSESLKKAYAEGRHAPSLGLKKGTILGPMSDEEKVKRSLGMKKYVRTSEHEAKRLAAVRAAAAKKKAEKDAQTKEAA